MVAVLSLLAIGVAAPLLVQASPPPLRHSYTDYLADKPAQGPFGASQEQARPYGQHPSHKGEQPNFSTVGGIPWDPRQDLGTAYNGLRTFSHAQPLRCTGADNATLFDVAVLGAPCMSFFSAVSSKVCGCPDQLVSLLFYFARLKSTRPLPTDLVLVSVLEASEVGLRGLEG